MKNVMHFSTRPYGIYIYIYCIVHELDMRYTWENIWLFQAKLNWINEIIFLSHGLRNLFHATKDSLFEYDMGKSNNTYTKAIQTV